MASRLLVRFKYRMATVSWALFLMVISSAVLITDNAWATVRPARNPAEQAARSACISGTQGAIWLGSNNSFTDGGYMGGFYEMNVNVPATPGAVPVYIHGSANTCTQPGNYPNRTFYAINVSSGTGANDWRLSNLSATVMSRGTFVGSYAAYDWTSIPASSNGYVKADLNVDGLVAPGEVKDITIGLYRCPSYNGTTITGSCGTQQVVVHVTRAALQWAISGASTVSTSTAAPGQTVTFNHKVKNTGDSTSPASIKSRVLLRKNGSTSYGVPWEQPYDTIRYGYHDGGTYAANSTQDEPGNLSFTVPSDAVNGDVYCEAVNYYPKSSTDSGEGTGNWACVTVELPWVVSGLSLLSTSVTTPGTTLQWTHSLTNSTSYNMDVDLTHVIVDTYVGPSPATVASWPTAAQDLITSGQMAVKRGNGGVTFLSYAGSAAQYTTTPADIGKYVCQRITWTAAAWNNSGWGSTSWTCSLVAQAPYVGLVGGSAWSGGSVSSPYAGAGRFTGTSTAGAGFGSFGEYGIFSTGLVSNFGSGGKLGGTTLGMTAAPLTFSNTSSLGVFSANHQITDMTSKCTAVAGSAVVASTTLTKGQRVVYCYPSGTVTINGNITYDTTGVNNFAEVPQLLVVARDIKIAPSVTRVDGLLYASNSLVTCDGGPTSIGSSAAITTTGVCNKQLTINGSVTVARNVANSLVMNRSYGGATAGQPSEIFRMRPEVFLTPYEQGLSSNGVLTQVYENELPVRY